MEDNQEKGRSLELVQISPLGQCSKVVKGEKVNRQKDHLETAMNRNINRDTRHPESEEDGHFY